MNTRQLGAIGIAVLLGVSGAKAENQSSSDELISVSIAGETLGEILNRLAAEYDYTFAYPPGELVNRPGPHLYIEPTPAPRAFERLAAAYGACAIVDNHAMVDHCKFVRILPCDAVERFRDALRDASTVELPQVMLGIVADDGNAEGDSGTGARGAAVKEFFDEQMPAYAAGIKVGDVIVSYDGEPVSGGLDLKKLVGRTQPGDAVPVVVVRDSRQLTFTVQFPLPSG